MPLCDDFIKAADESSVDEKPPRARNAESARLDGVGPASVLAAVLRCSSGPTDGLHAQPCAVRGPLAPGLSGQDRTRQVPEGADAPPRCPLPDAGRSWRAS
jgi:hypothetical protein